MTNVHGQENLTYFVHVNDAKLASLTSGCCEKNVYQVDDSVGLVID